MTYALATGSTLRILASSNITYTVFGDEITTTDSFKKLTQGLGTGSNVVVYTVPAATQTIIKAIAVANSAGTSALFLIYVDGSAATNLMYSLLVPANGSATYDGQWRVYDLNGIVLSTAAAITATGDATGTQSGSNLPLTLATVNGAPGTFGSATAVSQVTVNGKGLATTVAGVAIQIAESQVTNLVTDLAGKQPVGNYITALTGDGAATGPGSVAFTLATVNGAPGTFGSATQVSQVTVNGKGLATTVAAVSIQIAESQVTNLVTDLAGKQPTGNYITALTGDGVATGPGSVAFTLATVNGAPGTFGSATQVSQVTVNGKGLATTVASVSIQIAESQVTNLVTDLAAKVPTSRLINTTAPLTGGGDLSADRTHSILAATTVAAGSMSAVDKLKENNIWVDMAAERGFVGDDATLNDAAWTAFLASPAPQGATLFFPAGTYRFANEVTLNQDKRWKFKGAGPQATYFKTTSITANIFNFTVAGFYTTWEDMGFLTTAVKTAGAGVAITGGNNSGCDMRRLSFNGMFLGIDLQGAQSGNVSVFDSLNYGAPPANGRMLRINGSTINLVVQNSTSNCVPNAGAVAGTANIEVNQSGAVQILACDLIGGINSLLLNANQGGGTSIAAIYVTNTFFDQSGGSTVKITGANTTNRIKFTQCGIAAGIIGSPAFEVAGTGAGGVGSATAMPAGISLIDCDIYYAPGASTSSGILINGCQDINIQNTRVAGFSGAGGSGIHVIPSSANQTRVRVNGCRIGPNSNLTINNTIGVQLDVGGSGLGALSITDNDIAGNGTAISDASTILAGSSKFINNNLGAANGLSGNLFAPAGVALTATEAIIAQIALPANSVKVGTTFRFTASGITTATALASVKLHIGPLGTVADPAVMSTATTAALTTASGLVVNGAVQISVVGATAGGSGAATIQGGTVTAAPAVTATGTFNSAVANFATLGFVGAAGGHTVRAAEMVVSGPA